MDLTLLFVYLVPVIIYLFAYKYRPNTITWQEAGVMVLVSTLSIFLSSLSIKNVGTTDIEYWGSLITKITYYEDWDSLETRIETYECGTTKDPQTCTRIETYVDYHPEYWIANTTINESFRVSKEDFDHFVQLWKNKSFKDMNRDYHSNDGDAYVTTWPGAIETARPIVTKHTYENKVQASHDVFNYPEVSEEDIANYKLFNYPEPHNLSVDTILGFKDPVAEKSFKFLNGFYGPQKRIRVWVLVFPEGTTTTSGEMQENFWKGGNKNEFIYCIGINSNKEVTWARIITWAENQTMKIEARDFLMSMGKLDLSKLTNFTETNVIPKFKKKDFREFDYLHIEPPLWAVITAISVSSIINLLVGLFCIYNDINPENRTKGRRSLRIKLR